MTSLIQPPPYTTTARRRHARRAAHAPAREARTRRSDDAVLASYIRELSAAAGLPMRRPTDHSDELR